MPAFKLIKMQDNHEMDMKDHSHIGTSNTSKILLEQRQIVPDTLCVRMRIQQTNRAAILYDNSNTKYLTDNI